METAGSRPKDDVSLPKGKNLFFYCEHLLEFLVTASLTCIFVSLFGSLRK